MTRRLLILGMGGLFGAAAARAFRAAGWDVDRYHRGSDVSIAARGARWIINATNPANTAELERDLPDLTKKVIAAARNSGASVIVPGNFHIYGRSGTAWGPDCPHAPVSRRAKARSEAEKRYREAADADHAMLMLRAGDFVMPGAQATLMNSLVLPKLAKHEITALGPADKLHIHADLEDLTRVAVALAETADEGGGFLDIPFPGTRFSARQLAESLSRQIDKKIRLKSYPWWRAQFSASGRQMAANRAFYQNDHVIDEGPFRMLFPTYETKSLDRIAFEHLYMRGMKVKPEGRAADQSPRAQSHGQAMSTQTIL
ncbi:hypothetical protein [Thioclava sp. FTW29]|uniref:Nucleoside-diphosphate-sugar epimerase n=1 Tax=Thioclava litoralis TaxID=3076557 RepID=A0ABZ1E2A3_9RHOB|nr:hypothetical protein RPE78_15245 [Thioclava sp. FTW29]